MQAFRTLLMALLIVFVLVACASNGTSDGTNPSEEPTAQIEETEAITLDTAETRGQELFVQQITEVGFACASCHHLTEARLIGPGLGNIATRFESYDLSITIEDYVSGSITQPQEYIVESSPEYPENVMPTTYGDIFTEEEVNDLVAYILSL